MMIFVLFLASSAAGLSAPCLRASSVRVTSRSSAVAAQFQNPFAKKSAAVEERPAAGKVQPAAKVDSASPAEEDGWTLDKVAELGLAGVLSIAVAESVFWVLSFPVSAIFYYVATGEWIGEATRTMSG